MIRGPRSELTWGLTGHDMMHVITDARHVVSWPIDML